MLEIQSSSRGEQKFFMFIRQKNFYYFVLKKYQQVSAIFTDTDTTSRYHKNRPIPPIPILKYRYITSYKSTFNYCFPFIKQNIENKNKQPWFDNDFYLLMLKKTSVLKSF